MPCSTCNLFEAWASLSSHTEYVCTGICIQCRVELSVHLACQARDWSIDTCMLQCAGNRALVWAPNTKTYVSQGGGGGLTKEGEHQDLECGDLHPFESLKAYQHWPQTQEEKTATSHGVHGLPKWTWAEHTTASTFTCAQSKEQTVNCNAAYRYCYAPRWIWLSRTMGRPWPIKSLL